MEELLQHCLRELAFDGDLGCNISRLRHFIQGFYASQRPPVTQTVDDAFHTFVWALLIQQPSVRIGLVPEGDALEVYIAPQLSKKKILAKPKKKRLVPDPAPFPALDGQSGTPNDQNSEPFPGRLQPIPETATCSLESLIHQYGNSLRIAVDPETSFRAITGSHTRPAKLSPMVYTALQLISRGREAGLSVIDLGKKTGYDQKTCFYLIKQLLALDLVVKLSKGGPGGGNFCIHKYFYARSTFWEGVRREEHVMQEDDDKNERDDLTVNEASTGSHPKLQFDLIDSRHLTSTQLIKSRLVKLLRNSENGLHVYQNLLVTIGFVNPTKRDRRFFIIRIRELIKEKVIEKVMVPKLQGSSKALCIRLVEDPRSSDTDGIVVQPGDIGDEEQEAEALEDKGALEDKDRDMTVMPIMNMTISRQILKLLEQAGPEGLTLNNISTRLGMLDKRTVELLLYRLERYPPSSHLADLATCDFIENQGRERRHRFYTLTGYLSFVRNESIDDAGRTTRYTSIDISNSGGFYPIASNLFYKDHAALVKFEDEFRDKAQLQKEGSTRKIGRPRKEGTKPMIRTLDKVIGSAPRPRGKGNKALKLVPQHEEGDQAQPVTQKPLQSGTKRKRKAKVEHDPSDSQPPPKKKRIEEFQTSSPRNRTTVDAMDVDNLAILQPPERPRNGGPENDASFQLENPKDRVIHTTEKFIEPNGIVVDVHPEPRTLGPATRVSIQDTVDTAENKAHHSLATFVSPDRMEGSATAFVGDTAPELASESSLKPRTDPSSTEVLSPSPDSASRVDGVVPIPETTSLKRKADASNDGGSLFDEHSMKRPKTGRPKRTHELVNISQLRAENEIMRVVEESGGIANVSSKEFLETHTRVLTSMVDAGEPTSMPVGSQPDRRTLRKILDKLVDRGRLKTLTATIIPRVTQPRLAKLIYEPEVTQEKLDQYLSTLREDLTVLPTPVHKKLDRPVRYTRQKRRSGRDLVLTKDGILEGGNDEENWRRNLDVLGDDENDVRSRFLSEAQTVAQLYGYLVGRARRARELHQFTLAHLQGPDLSSYIVSRTERIVAFPYYFHDLPVSTYFAIVSATEYCPGLSKLMESPEGRQTLVKDLPPKLNDELKTGRARARGRILSLLEILVALKLVTLLQPSNSTTPYLSCEPNGAHPVHFDVAPMSKDKGTVVMTASYWRFNTIAPIYLYSQTSSWPPPFHRDIFVRTADESMPFWFELEDVSLNSEGLNSLTSMDSITGPCACTPAVARTLRRRQSWVSSYVLSWSQKQYLQQKWTDPMTGYTPLSDQDGGRSCLERICNIISAPFDAVYSFFLTAHSVFLSEAERIHERDQRRREKHRDRQAAEDRAQLAKKAGEARRQLESDWDSLISRVHPAPLPFGSTTRLKELRKRYLQSRVGLTAQQWETAVEEAISGSKSGKRNPVLPAFISSPRKPSLRAGVSKLYPVARDQQKAVADLIERHKDRAAVIRTAPQKKKKGKKTDGKDNTDVIVPTTTESLRRQRFQWTPEYDDLARDASAIIRARCRTWYRMDWAALDQLFPFLPRNSVRQRIATLRQEAGGESYLRLLEDKWHELWVDHRGTEALPDDNPGHPAEFDAITHVEFLRKYIDKRALRVGLSEADVRHPTGAVLTEIISDFLSTWELVEYARPTNKLDFVWSSIGDEHREKTLLGEAFSTMQATTPTITSTNSVLNGVAESALKMTLTTREEEYDTQDAALLLEGVGQQSVGRASEDLLAKGVISELGDSHRKRPGRNLKISDLNEEALGGSFRAGFFLDACAMEDLIEDEAEGWKEWSPTAADGEMAALIELVSEGKVEFHIDISEPAAQREGLDWNSRKVDDDQIETTLTVCYQANSTELSENSPESPVLVPVGLKLDGPGFGVHGLNCGVPAACHKSSKGIITCSACIDAEQENLLTQLEPEDRCHCSEIIEKLDKAGPHGISYRMFSAHSPISHKILAAVHRLTSSPSPLCYWVGYNHPVLASRRHIRDWSVSIPGFPPHRVFPRRWLNIKGEKMHDIWIAGMRAVVGVLICRPGIPQDELRQRLISVYDRQELNDLLAHLRSEELIVQLVAPEDSDLTSRKIQEVGGVEEQKIYWSLNASMWYRVNA